MRSPIVRFKSDAGTPYAYDRASNQIVRLSEGMFAELDSLHRGALPESGDNCVSADSPIRAEYERARTVGLFADIERSHMKGFCNDCYAKAIAAVHSLTLCVTERCNLRCVYCSHSGLYPKERAHSQSVMSLDTAKAAIRAVLAMNAGAEPLSISFYGGECLLHFPLLRDIVLYAEAECDGRRVQFHFDTNGTLIRPEHVAFLLAHDTFVQVSIDGPRAVHDRFRVTRGGKGTFDDVIRALQLIRNADAEYYRSRVRFSVTISPPYDLEQIDNFLKGELFADHVVSAQFVDPFDTVFYEQYEQPRDKEEYDKQFKALRESFIESLVCGTRPSPLASRFMERMLFRIHKRSRSPETSECNCNGCCIPGTRKIFVDVHGNLQPCERVGGAFVLGTVTEGLQPERMRALVDEYVTISEADCASCWAARLCGLCFASARTGMSLNLQRKRAACATERRSLRNGLQIYTSILERNPSALDYVRNVLFT